MTRTATREQSTTGCTGFLHDRSRATSRTAATCSASSARATPTRAAERPAPPLTTVEQIQIRQKRQEVEYVVNQSGTTTAANTDGTAPGVHRDSLGPGDWMQLNGPYNLFQIDTVAFR